MSSPGPGFRHVGLRQVFLRDMRLDASIGVLPREQGVTQRLLVNVSLSVRDEHQGVGPDELDRVVDYAAAAETVRQIVGAGHVRLVETLAERLAVALLADSRVRIARVRVEKLDVFADALSAGVEVERHAADAPPATCPLTS